MINLSQKNIVRIAGETGFIKDNVEKVLRLADILDLIFSSEWKCKLVLKGGTAINLFYRDLPRLSVDIDLDYIGESREQMLADRESINAWLKAVLFQRDYSLSEAGKTYFALDSQVFRYKNNAGNTDNIKVEINFLDRAHVLPTTSKVVNTRAICGEQPITVLNKHELYGSKLAALIGRCKPRDIYDVYGLIKSGITYDKNLLRKCAVFYNCIGGEANIHTLNLDMFDTLSKRDFDRMLKPMLSKSELFNEKEAVAAIKEYLTDLLNLTESEKQFSLLFGQREYCPELLFDDGDILDRIKNHPMALWKCKG